MRRLAPLLPVLGCALIAGCGGGEAEQRRTPPKGVLAPGQVVRNAPSLKTVSVRGRAFPVGRTQLVLAGGQQSIFVFADPEVVRGIRRPGQRVVVKGPVRRLSQPQATELGDEVATLSEARGQRAAARRPPEVLRAPRTAGAPYVELVRLAPAGVSPGARRGGRGGPRREPAR